jgi:hypothetical protein
MSGGNPITINDAFETIPAFREAVVKSVLNSIKDIVKIVTLCLN